ncbi:MAG: DUF3419 family protein [Planctomycetaceae bacterium]
MTDGTYLERTEPDPWAREAAALPLAFAQVREDPRIDLHLVRDLPPHPNVVMIASGGETAITLGREPLGALHLVDMNRSQLALTRFKWELAGEPPDQSCAILGHLNMPPDERSAKLTQLFDRLDLDPTVFGPWELVSLVGPDHAGRYERTFAALRSALRSQQVVLDAVLASNETDWCEKISAPGSEWGRAVDHAFSQVMSLPNLVQLFGTEATQNPRRPFAVHFADRTRTAFKRYAASTNPFLWQIFAGRFPGGHRYDWLQPDLGGGTMCRVTPTYHCGRMNEVLDSLPAQSADLVHLSNILDWLSPIQAETTLASASRVLSPGGKVIIRQLNSTLDIPAIPSAFHWDETLGQQLESIDRSFFYPGILVGVRP